MIRNCLKNGLIFGVRPDSFKTDFKHLTGVYLTWSIQFRKLDCILSSVYFKKSNFQGVHLVGL
jgi:hypothetical protein